MGSELTCMPHLLPAALTPEPTRASSTMPVYEEDTLAKMTVAQLRGICLKENIRCGKKQQEYINNILTRYATVHVNFGKESAVQKIITSKWRPAPSPMHQLYRDFFNLVDLADRKWNSVEEHHGNWNWKSKIILSILRFAVLNAWTYSTKMNYAEWKDWRLKAAISMMNCEFN